MKELAVIFFILLSQIIFSQELIWKHTGGPMGGIIGDMDINSKGEIYAGVYPFEINYSGLYKSNDNGESWNKIETQFEDFEVFSVYVTDNDDIFVGTDYQGRIYRSTDNGQTWENKANGYFTGECWALGESKDGVIFAGDANDANLYRSTNNGDSWEFSANLAPLAFAADSNNIIYAGTFNGLYTSTNNGLTWVQNNFLSAFSVSTVLIDSVNNVYCGTGYSFVNGDGVYFSDDKGQSWTQIGLSGKVVLSLAFDSEGNLYAGTLNDGLFKTTDNGQTWVQYQEGLYRKQVYRLILNKQDDIFIGSEGGGTGFDLYRGGGIFRSINGGDSFEQVGLPVSLVQNIELDGDSLTYTSTPSGAQVYNRISQKWKNIGLHNVEAISISSSNLIWAGTRDEGLFKSTDLGRSWISINFANDTLTSVHNVLAINTDIIFAATSLGLRRSTNAGQNWDALPVNTGEFTSGLFFKNNVLFVTGYHSGNIALYKSTDLGSTFEILYSDLSLLYSNNPISFTNNGYIYIASLNDPDGILRSTDGGTNWEQILFNPAATIFSSSNDIIITSSDSIYLSYDYGSNWVNFPQPLWSGNYVTDIKQNKMNKFFFATSASGLYEVDIVTDVKEEILGSNNFYLGQNYPNPFNPSTKIKFTIWSNIKGEMSNVSLKIYDILGNKIKTLVDEYKPAGSYEVDFDASNLSNGVYFYRLISGSFAETKKMILLR